MYERQRFEELFIGKPDDFVRERLGDPDDVDVQYAGMNETGTRSGHGGWDGTQEVPVSTYEMVHKTIWRYDNRVYDGQPEAMFPHVHLRFDADDRFVEKILFK